MLYLYAHTNNTPLPGIQPGRTCRVGASIVPGACHVGARGLGMLGAEIIAAAATGEHGAGLMANDGLAVDREYRLVISASTFAAGTLVVLEDGAIEFTGPGTATQSLYESGALVNTATLDAAFNPPTVGVLPSMQAARAMPAVAGGYAPPGSLGVLPAMQLARTMPAIAGSYAAPTYSGALGAMVGARSMPAFAGSFSAATWSGTLGSMQAASSMPALAATYQVPTYAGALPAMNVQPNMPGMTGLYSAVAYNGSLAPMVAASSMPALPSTSYVAAWQRALREYTLLAPVDQIDNLGGFAEKDPAGRTTLAFEFKRYTSTPDSATVEIAVWRGADSSALSVLDGAPAIVGTKVYQRVLGGLHDTDYKLTCMLTDAGGQAYVLTGVLPVRRR
jgi:hypothetical protein